MYMATTEEDRFRRTRILKKLSHADESGHMDRVKYLTMIQAWNLAAARAMPVDYQSAYCFRDAFPIPVQVGQVPECSSRVVMTGSEDADAAIKRYAWHPSRLDWKSIAEIRTNLSVEIGVFQDSLRGLGRDPCEATPIEELNDAIAKFIAENQSSWHSVPSLIPHLCTFALFEAIVSSSIFGLSPIPILMSLPGAGLAAYNLLRSAVLAMDRSKIGNALQKYGFQYNLYVGSQH
jgi:hypothetical protein